LHPYRRNFASILYNNHFRWYFQCFFTDFILAFRFLFVRGSTAHIGKLSSHQSGNHIQISTFDGAFLRELFQSVVDDLNGFGN
jgi:hypothetical protein